MSKKPKKIRKCVSTDRDVELIIPGELLQAWLEERVRKEFPEELASIEPGRVQISIQGYNSLAEGSAMIEPDRDSTLSIKWGTSSSVEEDLEVKR